MALARQPIPLAHQQPARVAVTASMAATGKPGSIWILGMLEALVDACEDWAKPLAVVLITVALWVCMRRRQNQSNTPRDARSIAPPPAAATRRRYSLVPDDKVGLVPALNARDSQMNWLEGMVSSIYEVSHGIFHGEQGGEQLPSWQPGEFADALRRLRQESSDVLWPDAGTLHEPLDDVALCARLIASGLDVAGASELLRKYAAYRSTTQGGVRPPSDWLNCGIALVPFEDNLGRPVVVIRPRYHVSGNIDVFRAGLRSTLDAVKSHLLAKRGSGFSETNPLEQYAMVWDFEGAGRSNLDWQAFNCTLEEGAFHYPNMGSQIYILNVSTPFRWIWAAASRLMHPRITRKCLLVAPQDVPKCMLRLVTPELLPPAYGGTGRPWCGPHEAKTLEDQLGDLVAKVLRRQGAVPAGAKPSRSELGPSSEAPPARRPRKPSVGCLGGCFPSRLTCSVP